MAEQDANAKQTELNRVLTEAASRISDWKAVRCGYCDGDAYAVLVTDVRYDRRTGSDSAEIEDKYLLLLNFFF